MSRIRWTCVPSGDGRHFIYSPRFGRTYLVCEELVQSSVLLLALGLRHRDRREGLCDPARTAGLVGSFEKPFQPRSLAGSSAIPLERLYLCFHRHRSLTTIERVLRWGERIGVAPGRAESAVEIGEAVVAVEQAVEVSDCYPRALLTAWLCLRAGLRCQVTVGILAPTSKLHAWCSIGGVIPYEPVLHHWWYQPLTVFDAG